MNFLDKNTSVEWANTLMKDTQDNSVNLLSTSHHETTVEGGSHQIIKYINKGFQVIQRITFIQLQELLTHQEKREIWDMLPIS